MIKPWTNEEVKHLLYRNGKDSISDIAEYLNRTHKSVEHKLSKIRKNAINVVTSGKTVELKTIPIKNIDIISELKKQLLNLPKTEIKTSTYKPIDGDTLIVHFTDWHVGRIVKNEDGNEIYDIKIFKERVNKLLSEILTLLDSYITKGTPIKDVVILSTGDILDGMGIFSSQETVSETSPPFQVMLAVEVIQNFILSLTDRKLSVSFYGVRGNHGEIREGGKTKDPNANWDLMLYLFLQFWAKVVIKNGKIKVYYSELDYLNLTIQGWKYHIRHIAPQQSETATGKAKFLGWARKHNCDVIISGHYHHYSVSDKAGITIIKGGSLVGSDEYSEQLAEESEPIQLIFGCSKNRPMTFLYAIDLGVRKSKK
jgi:predicted phosphodiesterase